MERPTTEQRFILNFHGLGRAPRSLAIGEQDCWLDRDFFETILEMVRNRSDVQITFDDSNESDYALALPALRARKMVAKFFVVADRIGGTGFLSRSQIQSLASSGMSIGTHGMHHRPWAGLSDNDLHEELIMARQRIEAVVNSKVTEAACPFGSYNRRVLGALRNLGYERVFTSDEGPALASSWMQPRNTIRRTHTLADVQSTLSRVPRGVSAAKRTLKLLFKRLR